MAKTKDFYGKDITDVIEKACREYSVTQDALDIEVIETGSAGIFGLCKKKAHVRVALKTVEAEDSIPNEEVVVEAKVSAKKPARAKKTQARTKKDPVEKQEPAEGTNAEEGAQEPEKAPTIEEPVKGSKKVQESRERSGEKQEKIQSVEPPSDEIIAGIKEDLEHLLQLMGNPSQVEVVFDGSGIHCKITGDDEESIVGPEGRTLDSLQYLLRKMMSRRLPDRMMLSLNAGDFRERRAEELKVRAVELATQVKEDGKTQAIPALNPSERRVVHMVLQEDKGVRSRSVGEGLFKKVLIYKPGKGKKTGQRKQRGKQGGRPAED